MFGRLVIVVRSVAKRFTVDRFIVGAAAVTILLAMVLLAAGPIYSDAAARSALRRTLEDAPPTQSAVDISVRVSSARYEVVDDMATGVIDRTFDGAESATTRTVESESFAITAAAGPLSPLAIFRFVEGIEQQTELEVGAWPRAGQQPLEVAVSRRTADALDAQPDDLIELTTRRADASIPVRVVGVFTITDPTDPTWAGDELALTGRIESASFATHGPFVIPLRTMLDDVPSRLTARWRVTPAFDDLRVADAQPLRTGVSRLQTRLTAGSAEMAGGDDDISEFEVASGLVRLLGGTERSLTVTRSNVMGLIVQLALLSGYALALVAGLLAGTRRNETALVIARGAGRFHLFVVALIEAVMLTVPAVVVAPWIASRVLLVLNVVGPLADIGLDIEPEIVPGAYLSAGAAASIALVLLVWPPLRSARTLQAGGRRPRSARSSGAQRAGVDLALLGLAVAAFWQLSELGDERAGRFRGRFDVDPLLIIAPALGMLAGAVLALRVIPLLARLAERAAGRTTHVVPALVAWQVSRRPLRYGRSALLLITATSLGIFVAAYSSTWLTSQADQASHQVGADVRLSPNRRTNDSIGDLQLGIAHEAVAGVSASMAVDRRTGPLVGAEQPGQFVILDAARAATVVKTRDPDEFERLAALLVAGRPTFATIEVPGRPQEIGVRVSATERRIEDANGDVLPTGFAARLSVVVADAAAMLHRIDLGIIEPDGETRRLTGAVADSIGEHHLDARLPLSIVAFEVRSQVPDTASRTVTMDILAVEGADETGRWLAAPIDNSTDSWDTELVNTNGLDVRPSIIQSRTGPDDRLRFVIESGSAFASVSATFGLRPGGTELPEAIPVLVTDGWLTESSSEIGDETRFEPMRIGATKVRIAGAAPTFSTVDPLLGHAVIADLPSVQAMSFEIGVPLPAVTEYWVATTGEADVSDLLSRPPFESVSVLELQERVGALRADPVARGTIGALSIGFVASAVFASLGFAVAASVSARERLAEFALLRALGLSTRRLRAWLAIEQSLLVVVSLLCGTIVGLAVTSTILPLISLSRTGTAVVPDVQVVYPWVTIGALMLALVAVLAVVVMAMGAVLRRTEVGSQLRIEGRS